MITLSQVNMMVKKSDVTPHTPFKICMHILGYDRNDPRVMRSATALQEAGFAVSIVDIAEKRDQPAEEEIHGIFVKHILVPGSFMATRFSKWTILRTLWILIQGAFAEHHQTPRHATIVRFFGAYGPYEPPRKLYTKLVRQFAFKREPRFTVIGDGENYIDATYIDDAIRAQLAALTQPPSEGIRCIDLGVGSSESVNSVVTRAAHAFGLEPQIMHEASTAEYIRFVIDPRPFTSLYQFTSTVSLEVGLKYLADHLEQEDYKRHAEN